VAEDCAPGGGAAPAAPLLSSLQAVIRAAAKLQNTSCKIMGTRPGSGRRDRKSRKMDWTNFSESSRFDLQCVENRRAVNQEERR
jgi:hypothetical protein